MFISLHRAPLGNLEARFIYQGLQESKRRLWKWNVSLHWSSVRGARREGSFIGDPEGYIKEGSGDGHLSP